MDPADVRGVSDVARGLLDRHGHTAVGVAKICQPADVVASGVHHLFPTQEELLDAVIGASGSSSARALGARTTTAGRSS